MSCPQIWNIEQEKDRERDKVGGWPAKPNDKKGDRDLGRQIKKKEIFFYSGSARVFGYTVYRGFLNRVYGILQLKYGYSVYHFL